MKPTLSSHQSRRQQQPPGAPTSASNHPPPPIARPPHPPRPAIVSTTASPPPPAAAMEKVPLTAKSSSFTAREEKKPREPARNLSLNSIHFLPASSVAEDAPDAGDARRPSPMPEPTLPQLSADIDVFLSSPDPERIPDATIDRFSLLVEKEIARLEPPSDRPTPLSCQDQPDFSLLQAIHLLSRLDSALGALPDARNRCVHALNHTGVVLNHAMSFLEEEFRAVLDDPSAAARSSCKWTPPRSSIPEAPAEPEEDSEKKTELEEDSEKKTPPPPPPYTPEQLEWLRRVAEALCSAGYDTECYQAYVAARRGALEVAMAETGLERAGVEDVQKMPWETLEREIATWVAAFRRFFTTTLLQEREVCEAVFAGDIVPSLYGSITRGPMFQLTTIVEAVAMTKRSSEKLFKFLDAYEALRDLVPTIDALFPSPAEDTTGDGSALPSPSEEYKSELSTAKGHLGEAAVGIFADLEASIKSDSGKTPVPGGAVHPLTRYVMNYVRYTGDYKGTLVQVFQEHRQRPEIPSSQDNDEDNPSESAFATQLAAIMGQLDGNLEGKAKLYKDPSLSSIFLMNNGRYMLQKIKGSPEINELLRNTWCRKRSSDLRQYHKSYQRETWGKVLACFRDEGLTVRGGGVSKPVLKERFKSFNALLEEIHKTQSTWVVSDEQLQSELRVSVSAVVVPAYRSFLSRFQQHLDAGRHTERYIKFAPDDLENYIDELFDGNAGASMARRKP